MPPIATRISRWAKAVIAWKEAGSPKRSDEDVQRIVETLCTPCDHFTGSSCRKCGCRISKSRQALVNKVRMATESCPIGKW